MANRFLQDLKTAFPDLLPSVAVDVGANTGRSTRDIREAFPKARIYAFEPILRSFETFREEAGQELEPLELVKMALSNQKGYAVMTSNGTSNNNHLLPRGGKAKSQEDVNVVRGDEFFEEAGVRTIDFLRVNTAGSELGVLAGLSGFLRTGSIHAIQVTCTFSQGAGSNSPFEKIASFLSPFGYDLFGINSIFRKVVADRQPTVIGDAAFVHGALDTVD